jgi:hypothetical protein
MGQYEKSNRNRIAEYILGGAMVVASAGIIASGYNDKQKLNSTPIKLEGFAKNFTLSEAPNIPTKGKIIRVEKIPGIQYDSTVLPNGVTQFRGPFEYEIAPSYEFMKEHDGLHTDKDGNDPHSKDFWTSTREGIVTGFVKKESIDDKLETNN